MKLSLNNPSQIIKTVSSLSMVACLFVVAGCTTGSIDTHHSTVVRTSHEQPFTHKGVTYSQCPTGSQFLQHYQRKQENWTTDGMTYWSVQTTSYQSRAKILTGDFLRLNNVQQVGNRIFCHYVLHHKNLSQRSKQLNLRLETHPFKQLKVAGYNWNKCTSTELCHSICRTSKPSTCPFDYKTITIASGHGLPVPVHPVASSKTTRHG